MRHLCEDFTDVTLADEDTNSILTDNANRVDHSDGHFFKTMEWSMVFEKKPL